MRPIETVTIAISPTAPEPERIAQAAAVIQAGGLVAFPTETVYGLGANALDAAAVGRIFAAKGRPANNPIIVHIANTSQVHDVAVDWPDAAQRLAAMFWPGPLTLVLAKNPRLPDVVTGGGPTAAVRMPAHPVAVALVRAAGVPIAAPSANRSERLSPTRAEHVLRDLRGRIDMVLDGGHSQGGLESTVIDVSSPRPRLLRPGLITPIDIEGVIGNLERPTREGAAAGSLPSPGMLPRHYAPRAPLECVAGSGCGRVEQYCSQGLRVGWLVFAEGEKAGGSASVVRMPVDPLAYATRLYDVLHELDAAGVDRIVVELPPEGDAWLAIRDRLTRAATPRTGR